MERTKPQSPKPTDALATAPPRETAKTAIKPTREYEKPKIVRVRRVLAAGGHSV